MVNFANEFLFYFTIPVFLVFIWYFIRGNNIISNYKSIGSDDLRLFILSRIDFNKINIKSFFLINALILLFIASLGPQIGTKLKKINKEAIDIYILIDTSISMDAVDVSPSRIKKSIIELNRFVDSLKGDRVGIIVFAESSHIHCPLTTDYSAVKLFLNSINTNMVQNQGTNIYSAIDLAINNIYENEDKYKTILLVSDGEEHNRDNKRILQEINNRGINIHTLGVGTLRGGPVPIYKDGKRTNFKKDKNGKVITSAFNEHFLYNLSNETGGVFVRVQNQPNAINPIIDEINNMKKRAIDHHIYTEYDNKFQIFLLLSLLLFIVEFFISTNNKKRYVWKGKFRE